MVLGFHGAQQGFQQPLLDAARRGAGAALSLGGLSCPPHDALQAGQQAARQRRGQGGRGLGGRVPAKEVVAAGTEELCVTKKRGAVA